MPLVTRLIGNASPAFTCTVDARRLMAYAAGIDADDPAYFDTTRTLACHPLFPVCLEWDPILAVRTGPDSACLSPAEQARAVHAEHDLHLLRQIRPGMTLRTVATIVGIRSCAPGALMLKRIDTHDEADGTLVTRTFQSTLYRDIAVSGDVSADPPPVPALPPWHDVPLSLTRALPIPAGAAHVYSECARIWNPIHTDLAHARAAGLEDIILHGTATLARAVTGLLAEDSAGRLSQVTRIACRFSGMVRMPSMLTLRFVQIADGLLQFEVQDDLGRTVISRGRLVCVPATSLSGDGT